MAAALGMELTRTYGISVVDYNNDGLDDVYIAMRLGRNKLFKNLGNGAFEEVSRQAFVDYYGEYIQACWADIDNDGFLDFYLGTGNYRPNLLFRNNGRGGFEEIGQAAGVQINDRTSANMLADVNNDGLVDLYLAIPHKPNYLFLNNGDLTFTDVTEASGAIDELIAMGSGFFDYDNDGDQDLYLSHDTDQANILYRNDGNGVFTDVSAVAGVDYVGQAMGVDFADFDHDGWQDIYITNLFENVLFRNNQDGTFSNVSEVQKVDDYGMA